MMNLINVKKIRYANSPGFTMVELIVILAIIAVMALALVPTLSQFLPGAQLSGATRVLTADLREAQEKAVTEQDQYLIRFNPSAMPPSYQMIKVRNSVEEAIRSETLANHITLTLDQTITNNQIVFSPDGGPSSSGNITLHLGTDKIINVSPAGFIAIH